MGFYGVKATRTVTVWYPAVEANSVEEALALVKDDQCGQDFDEDGEVVEVEPLEVYLSDADSDDGYGAPPLWKAPAEASPEEEERREESRHASEDRSCLNCGEPCRSDNDGESLCCGALTISGIRPGEAGR